MIDFHFVGKSTMLLAFFVLSSKLTAQTWTPYTVGSAAQVMRIEFPTDDTGYVSLDDGTMRKTTNGAVNWTSCTPPMNFVATLAFTNGTKGFAPGLYGIKMTTDAAATWNYVELDSVNYPLEFCAINATLIYAAYMDPSGNSLYLYKSTNGGANWNLMPVTTMVITYGDLLFIDSDTGYISAADCIFKTTDGGVSWDTSYFDISGDMVTYLGSNDGVNIYAATQSLQFLVSTDAGNSWNPVGPGNPLPPHGISFVGPQAGFVAGGDGISSGFIDRTINGGLTWTNVYNGVPLNCMDFPSNTRGYAGGKNGTVVRYEAGPQSVIDQSSAQVTIFPNPANDFITLQNTQANSTITITNCIGETVFSTAPTESQTTIDVSSFSPGIYLVQIHEGELIEAHKLVIQ